MQTKNGNDNADILSKMLNQFFNSKLLLFTITAMRLLNYQKMLEYFLSKSNKLVHYQFIEVDRLMIISRELAQKVVDQLMDIVQRNVNIMDCNGIIIASGQRERINSFHQGGKLAVSDHNVIEILPSEVQQYAGALPGVMWPIDLKKKTVGVVGVTGEPREVRNTAKLVKTVTELILEREMFLANYRSENRVKAQLVELLFSDNPDKASDDINTLAEMLNYKMNLPRMVILTKLEPLNNNEFSSNGLQNLFSARIRENVLSAAKEATHFSNDDIGLFYKKNLCIIKAVPENFSENKMEVFISSLINMLNSVQPRLKIEIGIGSVAQNTSEIRNSYDEAFFALEHSNSKMVRSIHDYEVLLDYLLKKQCANSSLVLKELKDKFNKIAESYDMRTTLECLLANNMNVSTTADQLFIHRNTLKFRLNKFKKMTGLDPCHFFQHAMICKFILVTA